MIWPYKIFYTLPKYVWSEMLFSSIASLILKINNLKINNFYYSPVPCPMSQPYTESICKHVLHHVTFQVWMECMGIICVKCTLKCNVIPSDKWWDVMKRDGSLGLDTKQTPCLFNEWFAMVT